MSKKPSASRRHFLKTSIAAPVALATLSSSARAEETLTVDNASALPKRKLGRNGPEVTMLNLGGMMAAHSPQFLDIAWRNGIRYFDTADCYIKGESEVNVGKWMNRYPERRKDLFLVTKDHPKKGPQQLIGQLDERLEKLGGAKYVDLFFIHGIGTREYGEESLNWPKSDELRAVFDKIKASGKAKLCGFSCHDDKLIEYLNAAADGGFVDAIMLRYNPLFTPGDELDMALDRCYDAGIGLICMKEMRNWAKAPKATPEMEKVQLTTQQALLHKVWSDPRISSICSAMANVEQIEENSMAARLYKNPLPAEQIKALEAVASIMPASMCPGCPSCLEHAKSTQFAFNDISRYVTYYEQDGNFEARDLYQRIPTDLRNVDKVDLAALRDACQYKVDYPEIVRRAERYFA